MRLSNIALAISALYGGLFTPAGLFAGGVNGVWYDPSDLSTMFTTSDGTTPVTMPGLGSAVSVGLMLDKSQGLVLGPELVTNGTFDTNTNGWSASSGLTSATRDTTIFPAGGLKIVANGANQSYATQTISGLTVGKMYVISTSAYTPSTNPANNFATIGIQSGNFTAAGSIAQSTTNTIQTLTIRFFATNTTQTIYCSVVDSNFSNWGANGAEAYFDNISVRELPGNHAIAFNNTTARPELRARVNLLTYSEEFDNGAWGKAPGVTVTPNTDIAPDGTLTADTLNSSAGNQISADVACAANTVYTDTICFKKTSGATYQAGFYLLFSGGTLVIYAVRLNTDTGVATAVSAGGFTAPLAFSVADEGGYWRLFISGNSNNNTTASLRVYPNFTAGGGVGAGSQVIWGADLRPANIGANVPAYQRIADANTYDTSGFPLYLRFDGIDDSMYTPANLNLSGTDKVAVFAGVRKLTAGTQQLVELSSAVSTNNGAFSMPSDSGTGTWATGSKGTAAGIFLAESATNSYVAPVTTANTGLHDLSLSTGVARLRVNGSQVAASVAGTAGGNFGSYPLNIGVRSATSSPTLYFNGHLHSLIIAGSAVSAGNISATEQWVAGKTGVQI